MTLSLHPSFLTVSFFLGFHMCLPSRSLCLGLKILDRWLPWGPDLCLSLRIRKWDGGELVCPSLVLSEGRG